jgi:hypothetical protein
MIKVVLDFKPTREAFDRIMDAYLDFYAAHPDLLNLWLHRRTGDAIDTADLDREYTQPYLAFLTGALAGYVPDPAQLDYALWTFPWAVSGFLGHGIYLHVLAHRLLDLPSETA